MPSQLHHESDRVRSHFHRTTALVNDGNVEPLECSYLRTGNSREVTGRRDCFSDIDIGDWCPRALAAGRKAPSLCDVGYPIAI